MKMPRIAIYRIPTDSSGATRRDFVKTASAATVAALGATVLPLGLRAASASAKMIGIQAGAVSFRDEGTERVLDTLQERGAVNTIFAAAFTYGRGIAGRQVPGAAFPDHGRQESDEKTFHGGNYATPHAEFYRYTSLKQTKAPDFGDYDVLADVLPKAHSRGMNVFAWYEDVFRPDLPGVEKLHETDLQGRPANSLCHLHPDYRQFLIGLTEDYCQSYPVDGVMWGSERQGPLLNAIGGGDPTRVTCFCELHQQAARARGIDVARARAGFEKLGQFVRAARIGSRPADGYFVSFWRLLLEYPEILAWEKLWTDSKQGIYADVRQAAKKSRPEVQVGFHIWHQASFSPIFRAEQDFAELAEVADFLKIVVYNNCGGPRYAAFINNMASGIMRDVPKDEVLRLHNEWLNYGNEAPLDQLPTAGLSSDYVFRETKRTLATVQGKCRVYPGLDIDVPTGSGQKKTQPGDVHAATTAALGAGADGVLFSRKYSEMKLANLTAGGQAVRDFKA